MLKDKLYLICGNCGCNDKWQLHCSAEIDREHATGETTIYQSVATLSCQNCWTVHFLGDYAEMFTTLPESGAIRLPKNTEEAKAMLLIAEAYLKQHGETYGNT